MHKNSGSILFSITVFLIAAVLSACTQGNPAITVKSPGAAISPMIVGSGSVFMEIVNTGTGDDKLIMTNAEIPGAITELHDMKHGKMIKIESIRIPSRSSVSLKPGSLHIMLFNMPKDVKAGYRFTLSLTFEKSGVIKVPVILNASFPASSMEHNAHSR